MVISWDLGGIYNGYPIPVIYQKKHVAMDHDLFNKRYYKYDDLP